mmetsp:Transcript_31380/g.55184  ORF Transcript_31380/g.55184 Transcript_31380/m.55184 type:complete len:483 (+) Transcript_31380:66-1514(+)
MPRELVTIQIGQCGIQLGTRFWDLALKEHAAHSKRPIYDDALSSFFRNFDSKNNVELGVGNGKGKIRSLKARSILVDMEEGVINKVLSSPLGELFDEHQLIRDVSGSGNNWAHGHCVYGAQYSDAIMEAVRRASEACDSLQSFFLMHSLGGGTGSGLGTYILSRLADEYPDVYRFTTAVFPSADDDVVTSPYNSILSLDQLISHADCVLPIENQALIDICSRIRSSEERKNRKGSTSLRSSSHKVESSLLSSKRKSTGERYRAFDDMNTIGAHLLCNLTCSMRFEGHLNVDLNEITMNLVPFPRLHLLLSSVAPLATLADKKLAYGARGVDQMFSAVFSREAQLTTLNPRAEKYLACGLFVRGTGIKVSDINRNIERLRPKLDMVPWNSDGFKVGLCSAPPAHQPYSALCLANNCAIRGVLTELGNRFQKLFRVRAHAHHYTEYMELSHMQDAYRRVKELSADYQALETAVPKVRKRLKPAI